MKFCAGGWIRSPSKRKLSIVPGLRGILENNYGNNNESNCKKVGLPYLSVLEQRD